MPEEGSLPTKHILGERSTSEQQCDLILANAQIFDFPIVYANDNFCKLTGYSRVECMQKKADLVFMHGELTEKRAVEKIDRAFVYQAVEQKISSLPSALKVAHLLRLGRVARKLDNYLEYGAATLILLLGAYLLVARWLACIWYTLGEYEIKEYFQLSSPIKDASHIGKGWLFRLAEETQQPFSYDINGLQNPRLMGGPGKESEYISALSALLCLNLLSWIAAPIIPK
uniref:PAS domain-containing protein n=1 Tax=Romanomermis culicivorax TaxID=13658 RepID=A0A915KB24_ROMCU